MERRFRSARRRIYLFSCIAAILPFFALTSGCGSDTTGLTEDATRGTGNASLSIRWHQRGDAPQQEDSTYHITALSDCTQEGVSQIACSVYQEPDALLIIGDPWPCSDRRGTLADIPAGNQRKFVCMGYRGNGDLIHLGQISGVEIIADQTTAAGVIDLYPFIGVLTTPLDGSQVSLNQFSLNWETVPNAHQYEVQVATDPLFETLVIDHLTTRTSYAPRVLLPQTTYYWRIVPVDRHGHYGTALTQREFTTLPGLLCRAPRLNPIGNQSVGEGQRLAFTVSATDPDLDDLLTFSSSPLPGDARFDPQSGLFQWQTRLGDEGYYAMIFTVCDSCTEAPLCDVEDITIAVGNICQPPVLAEIGPRQVSEGDLLRFQLNASDPDSGSRLAYSAANLPRGARFTPTSRTFSWVPALDQAGNYRVQFQVCDNCPDGPICDAEQVTITVGDSCRPPELRSIGNQQVVAGRPVELRLSASDPDEESNLTYRASGIFNRFIDPTTGLFRWTPPDNAAGNSYRVRFSVCDDCPVAPLCDTETISITVGFGCRPPELDPIGNQTATADAPLRLDLDAFDPDTDSELTFQASGRFSDAIDPVTGRFEWTPSADEAGREFDVTFRVCDDCPTGPLCDSDTIAISVAEVCNVPQLNPIDTPQEIIAGETLNFSVDVREPGPDADLVFNARNLPEGASFFEENRIFSWTPTSDQEGQYSIEFEVCNQCAQPPPCDNQTVTISVRPSEAPEAPTLLSPLADEELDNGCDQAGDPVEWAFSWSPIDNATRYQVEIRQGQALFRGLTDITQGTNWTYQCTPGQQQFCQISADLDNFNWRVRAGFMENQWGDWSLERRFRVLPLDSDCSSVDPG